jgi:hypothetical protein
MMFRLIPLLAVILTPASAFQQSAFIGRSSAQLRSGVDSSSTLCMATIAVFGASGLTASECVYQALKNGDKVVGLTR